LGPWVVVAFLGLVVGRRVAGCTRGVLGHSRTLARSIGMGGTANLVLWDLGYDPIVYTVGTVGHARSPTFVDDLAALVHGPRHAARIPILLLAVGH
jgi:uncharacterized membrane protein YGL010W